MLKHPSDNGWGGFPLNWSLQPQWFKVILRIMEIEMLAYTELMTSASTRGGQPYKPLVQGEIRVFLIHVVGLSPKEVGE